MRRLLMAALGLLSMACSRSPAPSGVFLTLSVSTGDVAVETRVNGSKNDYLSGSSGSMVASGPINANLIEGANEVTFTLTRSDDVGEAFEPWLLAALEIAVKGEIVDTTTPGERLIFQRELLTSEGDTLRSGGLVVITESFEVTRAQLKGIKSSAKLAPPAEAATAH